MSSTVFKRKIYAEMLAWKQRHGTKTALLIEGARRIGKSTIAETFAKNEYQDYILIDFAQADAETLELFNHISRLEYFFVRLQSYFGKTLKPGKSVIIFDEIQLYPKARQAIKYLVKDGRYDYIETGSLLSIKKNVKDILIPSEEHRINMYPLDFEEFLWAQDKAQTYAFIRQMYDTLTPAGDAMHRLLMREFRLYMLVGGMPQAVAAYLKHHDFTSVDEAKRGIIALYNEDLRKMDEKGRASTIFNSIPAELSRGKLRYQVGSVIPNTRPSRLDEIFTDLRESKTVNFAFHANDPSVGLALHTHYDHFKMYLADTGLFITLAFMDKSYTDNEIYRKLLSDKLSADLGYIFENVVAQMLQSAGNALYYHTFKEKASKTAEPRTYEIDFLVGYKDKICPIEVKSSGYKTHKSLDVFQQKYASRIHRRFLLSTKDLRKEKDLICLPVYMAGLL